ncbi:MAG: acetyl-CoA C-acetyltransferase [Deltaproteobacteria bacterium]|nr:acetyl-CoA C-acetyltransferase [Deltaproteobacteria bacterium]
MSKENDIVIIGAARTPIGRFGGVFKTMRAYQLAGVAMAEAMRRAGVEGGQLSDVILGDCVQTPDEANTARTAALGIGIPAEVPAVTIQRQCSSAMQAIAFGAQQISCHDSEVVLAGGCESMSSAPYVLPAARWGARLQHGQMMDSMWEMLFSGSNLLEGGAGYIMGQTAENLAQKYDISREEQDIIALRSHNNAEAATKEGRFSEEIVPVEVKGRKGQVSVVDKDEHIRLGLKMEDLSRLKPVFAADGSVTAGNSSGLNDGGAAVVLTSRARAKEMGATPLARIVAHAIAGVDPRYMGYGPVPATQKALKKAGLSLEEMELIEVNEAFAAQYLACEKNLGLNREITNVNGSGIGLGHPVGATGARIIISLLFEMRRRGNSLGLATLCVGGGMGMTAILEAE